MQEPRTVYYTDERQEFSGITRDTIHIDEHFPYLHKNPFWNAAAFAVYRLIMTPFAALYMKLKFHVRFVGRKKLRLAGRQGCFLFGNHTLLAGDAFLPSLVAFPKKVHVVVNADNLSIKGLKNYIMMCGAIPLAETLHGMARMNEAVAERIAQGCCVTVYPEAHIWPYYTKIRPFPDTSMRFPVRCGAPVFTSTVTYAKRRGSRVPRVTVYIDGPFYPDKDKTSREACRLLRDTVYDTMCRRAANSSYEVIHYEKTGQKENAS